MGLFDGYNPRGILSTEDAWFNSSAWLERGTEIMRRQEIAIARAKERGSLVNIDQLDKIAQSVPGPNQAIEKLDSHIKTSTVFQQLRDHLNRWHNG